MRSICVGHPAAPAFRGVLRGILPLVMAVVFALSLFAIRSLQAAELSNEYQMKAAFLYKLTNFVEWPTTSKGSPSEPVKLGVTQPNPFGSLLTGLLPGSKVCSRGILVTEVRTPAELSGCQMAFIDLAAPDCGTLLAQARKSGVLTIGEGIEFLDRGGMIALLVVENRLRFAIDHAAATAAGFKISSKLLSLAWQMRR